MNDKLTKLWIVLAAIGLLILMAAVVMLIPAPYGHIGGTIGAIIGTAIGFLAAGIGILMSFKRSKATGESFKLEMVSKADWSKIVMFLIGYALIIAGFVRIIASRQGMAAARYEILLVGIILCGIGGGGIIARLLDQYRK